jgi:hypothetical protein
MSHDDLATEATLQIIRRAHVLFVRDPFLIVMKQAHPNAHSRNDRRGRWPLARSIIVRGWNR